MHLPSPAVERFLAGTDHPTPLLVLDPAVCADRYRSLTAAFPDAAVRYAVKACPEPAVLRVLVASGSGFDVASPAEVRLALDAGAAPRDLCYGNPVRGPADVAAAHAAGVRSFVTDSAEDLDMLAAHAPGARVLVRLLVSDAGSATPFLAKFGAAADEAVRLLRGCAAAGLVPDGVAFHAGSQQTRPATFGAAVTEALAVAARGGLRHPVLDIGGGFPVAYREPVPGFDAFAAAVGAARAAAVDARLVEGARLMLEPGRALVAEAGVVRATVLRVSRRPGIDPRRWVYLDVGRYSGLAETEGEAIAYALRVPGRSGPVEGVVLSGPTCDGDDVLYRRTPCPLPLDLAAGDRVDLLAAGAYTASYASVGFNGFGPPAVHVLGHGDPPPRAVVEPIAPGLTRRWRLGTVHHEATTPYQRVLIAETAHGTTLFCDDERQSAQATQEVYHEALFVPAALLAARRDRVLVIGSSEGVVSQLAVRMGAGLVDHVDIDADCVRACAEHLPYGYSPAELAAAQRGDGPVRMHHADGAAFVEGPLGEGGAQRYDIVVVDLPDERPDEPGAQLNRLYTASFLRRCAGLLTEGGVVVSQAGSPAMWRDATLHAALGRFHEVFGQVVAYVSDEHEWAFLTGRRSGGPDPVAEMSDRLGRPGWRPATLDAAALRAGSVLPMRLRARDAAVRPGGGRARG